MFRSTGKNFFAAPILASAMMLAATAHAQTTETIEGGRTTVALSDAFVSALGSLGVAPGTVHPTRLEKGVVDFPVTGGAIELTNAHGQILHSGGLTLTAGDTKAVLESFIIDTTGAAPVITGLVVANGTLLGRVPLFDLALPSGLTLPLRPHDGELKLDKVGVTLDATAAAALNSVFHVSAFAKGFDIGIANVKVDLPFTCDHDD